MRLRSALLVFAAAVLFSAPAAAQEYIKATWPDLLRTMVRFNAISLADSHFLDEYAIVTECSLYEAYYADDFKWNQVRKAVLQSIRSNIASFPMNYHYDFRMQLDRYDFKSHLFTFGQGSRIAGVNTFTLYSVEGTNCGLADVKFLPRTFRAMLDTPLTMEGIPLGEQDAKALLERMDRVGNTDRIIYARFNLRIVYIDPLQTTVEYKESESNLSRKSEKRTQSLRAPVRFDVKLDSIGFYEDKEMTRKFYQY